MIWGRSSLDGCDVCCITYTYDILFFGWMSKIGHEDWCRGWPAANKQSKAQTQTTSSPTVDELVNFYRWYPLVTKRGLLEDPWRSLIYRWYLKLHLVWGFSSLDDDGTVPRKEVRKLGCPSVLCLVNPESSYVLGVLFHLLMCYLLFHTRTRIINQALKNIHTRLTMLIHIV
jgi:hypothetical protein